MAQPKRYKAKDGTISWTGRIELPPDPGTGKRRQKLVTARTKKDWEVAAAAARAEAAGPQPSTATVAEVLDLWLAACRQRGVRETSMDDYETTCRVHLVPALGGLRVATLTPLALQQFYAQKKAGGASDTVVYLCHVRLSSALRFAVDMGLLAVNPARSAGKYLPNPYRRPARTRIAWTPEEALAFLATAEKESPRAAFWHLMLTTGCRLGEAMGMRWPCVDLDAGMVHICATLEQAHSSRLKGYVLNPVKNDKDRYAPLQPPLVALLREHRAVQEQERRVAGEHWHDEKDGEEDWVFRRPDGRHLAIHTVCTECDRLCAAAGVRRIPRHSLRHTNATHLYAADVPLLAVAAQLGHDPAVTARTYAHLTPDMTARVNAAVSALYYPEKGPETPNGPQ